MNYLDHHIRRVPEFGAHTSARRERRFATALYLGITVVALGYSVSPMIAHLLTIVAVFITVMVAIGLAVTGIGHTARPHRESRTTRESQS